MNYLVDLIVIIKYIKNTVLLFKTRVFFIIDFLKLSKWNILTTWVKLLLKNVG